MKSTKTTFLIAILFSTFSSFAQNNKTLKELLWESVTPCYEALTAELEEKNIVFDGKNNIDDTKNGYLKLSGSYPTCGCFCSNIAGAYRQADNNYTILVQESWSCSGSKKLHANRDLGSILPEDFGLAHFIPDYTPIENPESKAVFYLNLEIPRKGTDTKVSLGLIPFGIHVPSSNPLIYEYSEDFSTQQYLKGIQKIATELSEESTLDCLLDNEFAKISTSDQAIIQKVLDEGDAGLGFKNIQAISAQLKILKNKYYFWHSMEYQTIILGWNKQEKKFYIKEKIAVDKPLSFKDFLKQSEYWGGPSC